MSVCNTTRYNILLRRLGGVISWKTVTVICAILIAGYLINWANPEYASPLALGVIPFALPLMWFGSIIRTYFDSRPLMLLVANIVASSAFAVCIGVEFAMDLKYAAPGVPVLSLLLAMTLTWAFLWFCRLISGITLLEVIFAELAGASMTIMFMHQFIHFTLRGIGVASDVLIILVSVTSCYIGWRLLRMNWLLSGFFLGSFKRAAPVQKLIDRNQSQSVDGVVAHAVTRGSPNP
jgi:fucose 4-O-acetylase-like acetyltransferase